jgi:hypothetical protein
LGHRAAYVRESAILLRIPWATRENTVTMSHTTVLRMANVLSGNVGRNGLGEKAAGKMPVVEAWQEALLKWRTASRCAGGECIEVASRDGVMMLRDSTQPRGTVLRCTGAEWRSLVGSIKAGSFDGLRP